MILNFIQSIIMDYIMIDFQVKLTKTSYAFGGRVGLLGLIEGLTRAAQAPIGIWIADSHSARPEPAAPAAKTGPAHTGGSGHLRTSAIARTNGIVSPAVYILWLQLPSLTLTSMSRRSVPAKRRPARALNRFCYLENVNESR